MLAQTIAPQDSELARNLSETNSALARHMLATMDLSRKDRLFPADAMVFQTNPLNIAYGACGTALFLYDILGSLPARIHDWLKDIRIDIANYPPSLYSGIAGIAWSFAEMGMMERALEIVSLAPQSPLAFKTVNIFDGAAGWGLACLTLHLRTEDKQLLTLAHQAGDYLINTAHHDSNGMFWPDEESGDVPLGFAFGGAGISLFLLYLWQVTGDAGYLRAAREAIDFDVAHGKPDDQSLLWASSVQSHGHRPYWLRGAAGIASVLTRFAQILGEDKYLELARRAVRPCASFFSAAPHLFEGLASMGESLLDMYCLTGEPFYMKKAQQKATQILMYRIEQPKGIAFPGRYLFKISHDYGVGGAGIGLFLNRLVQLAPRRFHDIFPRQVPQVADGESKREESMPDDGFRSGC
jgi:hypothetical protein